MRLRLILIGGAAALIATGCAAGHITTVTQGVPATKGSGPGSQLAQSNSRSPELTQGGYLSVASNGEVFVQWTRIGSSVSGTLFEVYIDPSTPTQMQSSSEPFTGIISGASITLTVSGTNWTGTLIGSDLTLSAPLASGSIGLYAFHQASVAAYNAAVASTKAGADQAQAREQRQAQNRQILDVDAGSVVSDIQVLRGDAVAVRVDRASMAADISTERFDLASTYHDLQATLSASADAICSDATGATADSNSVQSDVDSVSSDLESLNLDVQVLIHDTNHLRTDNASLRRIQVTVGNYTPASMPSPQAVAAAVSASRAVLAQARAAGSSYMQTSKQLLTQANGFATQAQAACSQHGQ